MTDNPYKTPVEIGPCRECERLRRELYWCKFLALGWADYLISALITAWAALAMVCALLTLIELVVIGFLSLVYMVQLVRGAL